MSIITFDPPVSTTGPEGQTAQITSITIERTYNGRAKASVEIDVGGSTTIYRDDGATPAIAALKALGTRLPPGVHEQIASPGYGQAPAEIKVTDQNGRQHVGSCYVSLSSNPDEAQVRAQVSAHAQAVRAACPPRPQIIEQHRIA